MKKKVYSESEEERYINPGETKKDRFFRYLNYYKIPILVILIFVFVFFIMTKSIQDKGRTDFYIFFVTAEESSFVSPSGSYIPFVERIESLFRSETDVYFSVNHLTLDADDSFSFQGNGGMKKTPSNDLETLKTALLAGNCMCVIGDKASIDYLDSLGLLDDLSLISDDIGSNSTSYLLNTNKTAAEVLELDPEGESLYLALRVYKGTLAEKSKRATKAYEFGKNTLLRLLEVE